MPWADRVQGIVEAWYPGIGGAQSLANILFGDVNPSGRLAITFAKTDDQLPHPQVPGHGPRSRIPATPAAIAPANSRSSTTTPQKVSVSVTNGSSPSTKIRSSPSASASPTPRMRSPACRPRSTRSRFTVRNTGSRAGTEVAQVYAVLPASTGESTFKRLVAWDRVALAPGESKTVTLKLDPLYLSIFDVGKNSLHPRARRLHDRRRFLLCRHAPHRDGPHRLANATRKENGSASRPGYGAAIRFSLRLATGYRLLFLVRAEERAGRASRAPHSPGG